MTVYKKAFDLAMSIYEISKSFLKEERYALTDQMRSARSVCANMAEAFRKKANPAHFLAKSSDCDMENAETSVWLDFAIACNDIGEEVHKSLSFGNEEIGKILNHILNNPDQYCLLKIAFCLSPVAYRLLLILYQRPLYEFKMPCH